MDENLIASTKKYVSNLFLNQLPQEYVYHNWEHTQFVEINSLKIADSENLSPKEREILFLAVIFHDVGFVKDPNNHEEMSAQIAEEFLQSKGFKEINQVKSLILATKMDGRKPQNQLEAIIKDADCGHVGNGEFTTCSEKVRLERSNISGIEISKQEWLEENINFFKNTHSFHTKFAKENWDPVKNETLKQMETQLEKKPEKKKKKGKQWGRGVESLFRIQLKNHLDLSAIADSKANILLSVNAIIISLALSSLLPKLDKPENSFLIIPTFVLLISSLISIIMSIISTRPKVTKGTVTREQIMSKKTNILFFGNFYKMSLDEFEWGINYLMENDDVLYNSLMKDLYFLGLVLERKYRLLRITYNIFMTGIVISALAFIVGFCLSVPIIS